MQRFLTRREMLSATALMMASGSLLGQMSRGIPRPRPGFPGDRVPADRLAWRGIDASFLPQLDALGVQFFSGPAVIDPLRFASAAGINLMRLRVWVNPVDGYCGTAPTLALALRAHRAGMRVLINFHLSDSWADPGQQTPPAAWAGLTGAALALRVREYTRTVVSALRDQGTPPAFVQIGNEVTDGMLWPHGRISVSGWNAFAALVSAGTAGVLDALPGPMRPQFLLHTDQGGDNPGSRWFYDNAVQAGIPFDIVSLSYYPWWHGAIGDMAANLNDLASRHGRPVWLVEAAYPWTLLWNDNMSNFVGTSGQLQPGFDATPEGQRAYIQMLIDTLARVPGGLGQGLCYWAPEYVAVPGVFASPWENLALFDFELRALPGLGTLGAGLRTMIDR